MIEVIYTKVMEYLPQIIAVGGIVFSALKSIKEIKKSADEIKAWSDQKKLQDQINRLIQDNAETKELLRREIEYHSHVKEK